MKVLITTSGTGSRLGELTKYRNKSLVRVGKKPAISYIIDSYPDDTEFVVTIGHKGFQVKDFLELVYPDRKINFIEVDNYDGVGSSLGYSMLKAKDFLQCPFIFHACDTIVENFDIPNLDHNWVASFKYYPSKQYVTFCVGDDNNVDKFNRKGEFGDFIHIGLVGIYDFTKYWQFLENLYKDNPDDKQLNDVVVLQKMILDKINIKHHTVSSWFDIGNEESLEKAQNNISDNFNNLDKVDESIFFFDNYVIKFFADPQKIQNRIDRGNILVGLVPKIIGVKDNFYKYFYVVGGLYSEVVDENDIINFLGWAKKNLWKEVEEVDKKTFEQICFDFYKTKTLDRLEKFFKIYEIEDKECIINNELVPSSRDLLERVDFLSLSKGVQSHFHGDFVLENILKTVDGYCLLDWRQDFGGLIYGGDLYYDLAKLAHNLVVNHDNVSKSLFNIDINDEKVVCSIERKPHLVEVEKVFEKFLIKEGFDLNKVRVLRAIIWLNMAPLHHYPFSLFLHYFGRYHLWKALNS